MLFFFLQTEDGIRDLVRSRGLGDVYKRQTQDIGTAVARQSDFKADKMVYVVGNEQNYHFDVLKKTLKKLGYSWADNILHYSYGTVSYTHLTLPTIYSVLISVVALSLKKKTSASRPWCS